MTSLELVQYYANLLILQYIGKPKAYSTITSLVSPVVMCQTSVQTITFSGVSASGSFILNYGNLSTVSIAWNASVATIQSDLQALSGLTSVTVTGSIVSQILTVTFNGVIAPALLLTVSSNTLMTSGSFSISTSVSETDEILPLAVQDAFNITDGNIAQGVQLDVLGKYVGVTRNVNGPYGPISLDDIDFLTVIKFAILQNSSGSSLATIESNLNQFFPGQFIVTDYRNMYMSYIFSATLGTLNMFLVLLIEDLIPKPMGVGINVIIPPQVNDFFGFRTYDAPNNLVKPFNTYDNFNTSWLWLSYNDALVIP